MPSNIRIRDPIRWKLLFVAHNYTTEPKNYKQMDNSFREELINEHVPVANSKINKKLSSFTITHHPFFLITFQF